jgi:hypothetical protein
LRRAGEPRRSAAEKGVMPWYSIRSVYLHGQDDDGTNTFEERIVLYHGEDEESVFERAKVDSKRYLEINPTFRRIGEWDMFRINSDDDNLNAVEVWSCLSSSEWPSSEFYERRYTSLEVQPDEIDDSEG